MTTVMIPALRSCEKDMTAGERKVAHLLRNHLDGNCLIWYDIPQGKNRRYPDFIILHPSHGLLFLEIKDWTLKTINNGRINHNTWEINTASGLKHVAHPLKQARQVTYQVINALERDRHLQHHEGDYRGRLMFPYSWGVVFTNIKRNQMAQLIDDEATQQHLLPDHQVMYRDDLSIREEEKNNFQEKLWGMFTHHFPCRLNETHINRIRWHLFPEVRLNVGQQVSLFTDKLAENKTFDLIENKMSQEQTASIELTAPEIIHIMDVKQEQLARHLGQGHRVIHGVAGSGKTMILIYRCLHLAKVLTKPILVLCFNITLAAYLRNYMRDHGVGEKVHVYNIHNWCAEQKNKSNFSVHAAPFSPEYHDKLIDATLAALEDGTLPQGQYGAVLIDEGHDFQANWLRLTTQLADDTQTILLLYDDAQSIYKKRSSLDFSLKSVGINAQGRTFIMKSNYRNSQSILEFAWQLAQNHMQKTEVSDIPLIEPKSANVFGHPPEVRGFDHLDEEITFAVRCLEKWHAKGIAWNEIAILYPANYMGERMLELLKQKNIPFTFLKDREAKENYCSADNILPLMTIYSSKGLEFSRVIILGASKFSKNINLDEAIRILYVGLTRAREYLLVTFHEKNELSQLLLDTQAAQVESSIIQAAA